MGLLEVEFVKSHSGADQIIVEVYLDASPADVFRAWTNPNVVKRWFGRVPILCCRRRSTYAWVGNGVESSGFEGEYVVIEPERRLIFTWIKFATSASGERTSTQPSRVEISISMSGTGIDLRVTHSEIVDDEMRRGFANGWNRGIGGMRAAFAGASSHTYDL